MHRRSLPPLLAALLALLLATPAAAQRLPKTPVAGGCQSEWEARLAFGLCPDSTFNFLASGQYREGVPTPEQVLGYPIGSWHTTYGRMERYIGTLAAAAPERVRVFPIGQSVERQTMYLVAISSEQNLRRLEQVRQGLQALSDPRVTSQAEAERLIGELPIMVWLNSANDGNETAAFEAVLQIAYQLAAGEDARSRAMREGAVTLINMAHNPESHERHVAWYNAFVMGDANPVALEHRAPWGMSTNNNHYQLDLNRDALGLTQTESRIVAAELQRWRPQVFVDLHGQTTQYFFPPAADPINPLYPESVERWLDVFGRANAAAFDLLGWSYYTRDVFDLFYPGYWDTYPTLHGATGMTYETDGGGSRGVRWRRDDGTVLTFHRGIAGHFITSLATIEAAVQNRQARLRDYYRFFADALAEGARADLRTVILFPDADPDRAMRLATTLLRHGIEVGRVTEGGTVSGLDYLSGERVRRTVPAGAYLVDLAQPNGRLARTLLAPEVAVPERFTDQELARLARNLRRAESEKEEFAFYDVTAWSLPLAAGVPALGSPGAPRLAAEPLVLPEGAAKAPGGWEGDVAWPRRGGVAERARSAYLWEPGSYGATRLLARLLGEGYNVAVAGRELVAGEAAFPRGSYIARVGRNPAALHARIDELAREAGVRVHAAQTAYPERGPTGTGSESTAALRQPRVAVLAGEGVSVTSFGALWFTLERRIAQPFTPVRVSDLSGVSLDAFDVLVAPDGYGYERLIGERELERLRGWIERGGTLVAYAGAAQWVQETDLGAQFAEEPGEPLPEDTLAAIRETVDRLAPEGVLLPPVAAPEAAPQAPLAVPGAFLRGQLDQTHWLSFGYRSGELPLLTESLPLRASTGGANPVVYAPAERLVVSGFAWPANTLRVYPGRSYATADQVGDGHVVLFADDPLYRAVFDAPANLLFNAIYLTTHGEAARDY